MGNKKGQVAIFVILALIIVVSIFVIFYFIGKSDSQKQEVLGIEGSIEQCIRDAVSPAIESVMKNGGRVNPDLYRNYQGDVYNYLCYQKNFYLTCVNHYPMIKSIAEEEIKNDSEPRIKKCFESIKTDFTSRGFDFEDGELNWSVSVLPHYVKIDVDKEIIISKGETIQEYNNFETRVISPLYSLLMVAREIVNQESQYCNFEYNGYMLLYPQFDIKRFSYNGDRMYQIYERGTEKEFKFAVRSCAFPPGFI